MIAKALKVKKKKKKLLLDIIHSEGITMRSIQQKMTFMEYRHIHIYCVNSMANTLQCVHLVWRAVCEGTPVRVHKSGCTASEEAGGGMNEKTQGLCVRRRDEG